MVRNRQSQDIYRELRKQMIRETEDYLTEGVRHPERAVHIPALPVGRGGFTQRFASAFWTQALGSPPVLDSAHRTVICRLLRR